MGRPAILVLRGEDAFSTRLRENGFEVINLEMITTEPVDDPAEFEKWTARVNDLDGLFFTSPVAASVFLRAMQSAGKAFLGKIYVLGSRAKKVFEDAGIGIECRPDANTAEELIALFGEDEFVGKRLVYLRGDRSMRTIPELLRGKAEVDEVVVYKTFEMAPEQAKIDEIRTRLQNGAIKWLCFFSPSAVENFLRVFGIEAAVDTKTAAIGPTTGRVARASGLNVEFISQKAGAGEFARSLIEYIDVSE